MGCDYNAHHTARGSTHYNDRGEVLAEFLNSSNLEILNQGSGPTFCSGSTLEMIVNTLGSFRRLENVTSWVVSLKPSLS
jgi:hypothetical protein